MFRNILIVDDNKMNRQLLKNILCGEYNVLEAADGMEALNILQNDSSLISAVLLDIIMPEISGYDVLVRMRADDNMSQIPVIVTTGNVDEGSEVKALSLGANDYVTKPYNQNVIRHRLWNTIKLRETAAIANLAKKDDLTSLFNRKTFFEIASEMISAHSVGFYVMACFDIDNFKVINDQYGSKKGDEILKFIADTFAQGFTPIGGICCRMMADNYAVLYPKSYMDSEQVEKIKIKAAGLNGIIRPITFSIGRYIVDDISLTASAMYDRATIAEASVKGHFNINVALYSENMREKILQEQEIISEMNSALVDGSFEVWFQPQYNHSTGMLIGAEALVRWRHVEKGIVSPAKFIPVFERNGFIYELDKYVWEQVCVCLKKWIDMEYSPMPVSVNISRYDVFCDDLIDVLVGLTKKYDISPELLRLEITESAFAESADRIISIVKQFVECGFTVEIDDFGSGYSSLNMLKDVPANILKLDMRFLEDNENSTRGGNILESIIRMAKWLGMPVIAEGVETRSQADYLSTIGCNYIQGYYYARPMELSEYEKILVSAEKEERMNVLETVDTLDNSSFWDPGSMDTLIFNSYVGGACIVEYSDERVEIIRANQKYADLLGGSALSLEDVLKIAWRDHIDEDKRDEVKKAIQQAIDTNREVVHETVFNDVIPGCAKTYVRGVMRVIAKTDKRYLLYIMIENITELRVAESEAYEANEKLSAINDKSVCFARMQISSDHKIKVIYVNENLCRLLDMTNDEIMEMWGSDAMNSIHPDDVSGFESAINDMYINEGRLSVKYRVNHKTHGYIPINAFGLSVHDEFGDSYINMYYSNLSEHEKNQLSFREVLSTSLSALMNSNTDVSFLKDKNLAYVSCSDAMLKLADVESKDDIIGKTDYDITDKGTADRHYEIDMKIMKSGQPVLNYVESFPDESGVVHYANTSRYPLFDSQGEIIGIYGVGQDVTDDRADYARLKLLADSIPGGLAVYEYIQDEIRLLYFNDGFYKLTEYSKGEYTIFSNDDPMFLVYSNDISTIKKQINDVIYNNAQLDITFRITTKSGKCRWQNLKGTVSCLDNDVMIANVVLLDVTDQKEAQERLRMSEEQYRLAVSLSGNTICRFDVAKKILYLSSEAANLFMMPEKSINVPYDQIRSGHISPESVDTYIGFFEQILHGDDAGVASYRCITTNGWRWIRSSFSTIFSNSGDPISAIIALADITEEHRKEEEHRFFKENERALKMQAEIDGMTGLYNKATSEAMIKQRLLIIDTTSYALVFVDLDNLKKINDTLGHLQGDKTIRRIAEVLARQFRRTDIVGRIGGDEFIVFLDKIDNIENLHNIISSLFKKLMLIKIGDNDDIPISASIGVAMGEPKNDTFNTLYDRADKALYHAKRNGKKQIAYYSEEFEKEV